jgi:hypothetical protein
VAVTACFKHCGTGSGSGWVAVVPLDRGDRCGSNGIKMGVAVAVLAELCLFSIFFFEKVAVAGWQ